MSDLQKLRESILAKAHQEGQAQLRNAQLDHEAEYQEKHQHLMREKESAREHQLNIEAQRLSRLEQQMFNLERQENLKSRQELIDQLFDGAIEKINQWDSETLFSFISSILRRFNKPGIKIQLGELTKTKLSNEVLEKLNASFPNIEIVEEVIKQASGFVVRDARVDYNFTFEQLVSSLREEMSTDLAQQVFSAE